METEFRFNFFLWVIVNLIWGGLRLVAIYLLASNLGMIAGWTKDEAIILSLVYTLTVSILWIWVLPNLYIFPELVRKGDLDFALLKPVNTRFLVSSRYFEFDQVARLIISPLLLYYFLNQTNIVINSLQILNFIIVLSLGIFIIYNVYFVIITSSIWLIATENFQNLMLNINDAGMYPTQIFKGPFQAIFFFLVPVFVLATYPAGVLLGKVGPESIGITIIFAIASFLISQFFWHFALKRYSSASS